MIVLTAPEEVRWTLGKESELEIHFCNCETLY